MSEKMVCGVLVTVVGLVFSAFCFFYAVTHPCIYNETGGLMGAFLAADTLIPFIISTVVMCAGILLSFIEAYRKQ